MKSLICTILLTVVMIVNAATFDLGSKARPASASVEKQGERLLVSCRFTPLKALRNDPGRSAIYNDKRARALCLRALKLYLNIPASETMDVSGLSVAGPSRNSGSEVEYFFSVPAAGVVTHAAPSVRPIASQQAVTAAAPAAAPVAAAPASAATVPAAVAAAPAPVLEPVPAAAVSAPRLRTRTSFRLIKYKIDEGKVSITSSQEYSANDFPDRASFDDFCAQQFRTIARNSEIAFSEINRRFEENLHRINGFGE